MKRPDIQHITVSTVQGTIRSILADDTHDSLGSDATWHGRSLLAFHEKHFQG
jgi:hypothetical protein